MCGGQQGLATIVLGEMGTAGQGGLQVLFYVYVKVAA